MNSLEALELAASKYGFYNLDVKDNDMPKNGLPGNYQIVAYGDNKSVSAKGRTLDQCVEKLLNIFTEQG